MTALSFLNT